VRTKFDEAPLLEKARENSPGKFYYICNHFRHAADRKGYEAEQAELVEDRRLWISKCEDGTVLLSGNFDPEGGAAILTKLDPLARKSGAHDSRSREKRYGDALVEFASGGGSQAQIQVTSSLETLLGLAGAPAADMEHSSVPISATTVERLACDSSIARILLDSESMVIDVGRSKRVVSEPARGADRSRRPLPLAGLRAAGVVERGPSCRALDPWRNNRPRQPDPSLSQASPDGARGQLADRSGR
jgi:hypothetical protein